MRLTIALFVVTLSLSSQVDSKWDRGQIERQVNRVASSEEEWPSRRETHDYSYGRRESHHKREIEGQRSDIQHRMRQTHHVQPSTTRRYVADPPDHNDLIPMARYVIHNADWASIASISTLPAIEGFPFTNVKSMADGFIANSTGIPYFYMSPLDFTARDLKRNSRATVLATLEETKFCAQKGYDPEDPRCTRVMLSGKMKKVKDNSTEYEYAKGALFERHPSMANFPADHDFFVAKLKIAQVAMVDWFGGAKYVSVRDYLAYNYTEAEIIKMLKRKQEITVELTNLP